MSVTKKQHEKSPHDTKRKLELHALRHSKGDALEKAKGSVGRRAGVELDELGPANVCCRVGTVERVKLDATGKGYRALLIKGVGYDWDSAFDDARRTKDEKPHKR